MNDSCVALQGVDGTWDLLALRSADEKLVKMNPGVRVGWLRHSLSRPEEPTRDSGRRQDKKYVWKCHQCHQFTGGLKLPFLVRLADLFNTRLPMPVNGSGCSIWWPVWGLIYSGEDLFRYVCSILEYLKWQLILSVKARLRSQVNYTWRFHCGAFCHQTTYRG